jgi:hypothetical protein
MSSADAPLTSAIAPRILCAGIIVLDEVFRVEQFPQPDGKVQANGFFVVNGGCAANAAAAIARLGGRAALAGPMGGPPGEDTNGDRVLKALEAEKVDCRFCQRVPGLATALSAIFIDARGDRTIVTYRDERIAATKPLDADAIVAAADIVLADNRYPDFVQPICEAARRRRLPVVLDGDRPTVEDDPLFAIASHVIFSSECLRETTGVADLGTGFSPSAMGRTISFISTAARPGGCRSSRSPRSIRSAPATPFTAVLRSLWRRGAVRSRRCASAPPSPASTAPGWAARPARRAGRRSKRFCFGTLDLEYFSI